MAGASSSEHHHPLVRGVDTVSLYPLPCNGGWTAISQGILPSFGPLSQWIREDLPMKGVWGGDKGITTDRKPAIDSLSSVDPELLRKFIAVVVATGAAVSISVTRDFGAVVLTVLDGSNKHKLYPSDMQELVQALEDGIASFAPTQTPPNTRKR